MPGEDPAEWPTPRSWFGLTTRQRDFMDQAKQLAAFYSSAIQMFTSSDPREFHSASGFLLRLHGRVFLITNAHVIACYDEMKRRRTDTVFRFHSTDFEPRVISKRAEDDIDLCTIDVTDVEFDSENDSYWQSSAGELQVYTPSTWPLAAVRDGEALVTIGWPADHRVWEGARHLEFGAFPIAGPFVRGVERSYFIVPFDRAESISTSFDPANEAANDALLETALGGMSGAPVFAMHRGGVLPLELVGIVRTYGCGLDILYCTKADLIRTDGSIECPGIGERHTTDGP
jgi:hypothetical protein